MTPSAFLLYSTEIGAEEEVLKTVRQVQGVEYAHSAYGPYGGIAKINADTMDELIEKATAIEKSDKVISTHTMIVIEEKK